MTLTVYAGPLRAKPVDEIETTDVLAVLRPIWQEKPETASRLRGRIERVLNAAKAKGCRSGENPAAWRGHLENLLPKRQKLTRGHHAAMPYANFRPLSRGSGRVTLLPPWPWSSPFSPRRDQAKCSARDGVRSTLTRGSGRFRPSG